MLKSETLLHDKECMRVCVCGCVYSERIMEKENRISSSVSGAPSPTQQFCVQYLNSILGHTHYIQGRTDFCLYIAKTFCLIMRHIFCEKKVKEIHE